ncbi:MAG: hypothetical protein DRH57_09165 [Candidatus Cloacimonadota bacterium]|nr:MAG: hypothetical protein DRH57_09165 [Candidatus Cloacimonadota bacterium]
MTIKDDAKPKWLTCKWKWQKIYLYMVMLTISTIMTISFTANIAMPGILIVFVSFIFISIVFLDADKLDITFDKKLTLFLLTGVVAIGILVNTITLNRTAFIEMIKIEHPELVYISGGCSDKKEEVLKEYKLIKVNGDYSIMTHNKSYKVHDLEVYNYEEF